MITNIRHVEWKIPKDAIQFHLNQNLKKKRIETKVVYLYKFQMNKFSKEEQNPFRIRKFDESAHFC